MGKPRKINLKKLKFRNAISRRIAFQLLFWFLLIQIIVQSVSLYISYRNARNIIRQESINNLSAIAERQVQLINNFFQQALKDTELLAAMPEITEAAIAFQELSEDNLKNISTDTIYRNYKEHILLLQEKFAFDDIWLISAQGKINFTNSSQEILGVNLKSKQWKNTSIGELFARANILLQADFSDFSLEGNTKGSLYMAAPLQNEKGFVGVLIVKLKNEAIEEVLNDYTGLGNSGESILLIEHKEHALFVSDTRFLSNAAFVQHIKLNIKEREVFKESLKGQNGSGIIKDYRDKEVFARWVYVPALRAALMVKIDTEEAFAPIQILRNILIIVVIITLILVSVAAFSVASSFSKPIQTLTKAALEVAKGNLSKKIRVESQNEIGILAQTFNEMVDKLKNSKEALEDYAKNLEDKVKERTEELQTTNEELKIMNEEVNQTNEELNTTIDFVSQQKQELEKANDDILSSLNYAKRIQQAFLPTREMFCSFFNEYFIMFKPRDIVSGDFYWFYQIDEFRAVFAAADCTGHGVPGAFMSMIGNDILNGIVIQNDIIQPDLILNKLHRGIRNSLRQEETDNKDGMDIALIMIDKEEKKLYFSGAKNPILLIKGDEVSYIKGGVMPIGGFQREDERLFSLNTFELLPELEYNIYLYSDGFQDQFGGLQNRKFMGKNFRQLLYEIHQEPMAKQRVILEQRFNDWQQNQIQIDDILVAGLRIKL